MQRTMNECITVVQRKAKDAIKTRRCLPKHNITSRYYALSTAVRLTVIKSVTLLLSLKIDARDILTL